MKTKTVLISLVSVMLVAAMTALPVAADDHGGPGDYSCTTDVGLGIPGVISVSFGDGIGGCTLVVTTEDVEVDEINPGSGCRISWTPPGEIEGRSFEEGDTLPADANIFATCDLGTLGASSQVILS